MMRDTRQKIKCSSKDIFEQEPHQSSLYDSHKSKLTHKAKFFTCTLPINVIFLAGSFGYRYFQGEP